METAFTLPTAAETQRKESQGKGLVCMLTLCLRNRALEVIHRPDLEDGSQERLQQSLQAEPPLSPWSPTAIPDGMLSDCADSFDDSGLEGASDDSREPSDFIGNSEYDEAGVSEFLMQLQYYPGDFQSEPFQNALESQITYSPDAQVVGKPVESFGHAAGQPMTGRRSQPPSIVVSNSANDGFTHGDTRDSSESYYTTPLLTGQVCLEKTTEQHSYGSIALFQRSIRLGELDRMPPNNYELASQDRQPPDKPIGIELRSEETAAASMYAFCADADSTAADAAALCGTDTSLLHVKRRRRSATYHGFQIPAKVRSSQQRQNSLGDPPIRSAVQNSSRIPTPPLSFRDLPPCQHPDNITSRKDTLSAQTPQACNAPIEPLTPVSPSPSTLSGADNDVLRCPECPDTAFKGPNRKNSLQRHQRDRHSDMPRLGCLVPGCPVDFAPGRKDNRLKHVKATHPEYPLPTSPSKRKRKPDDD